MTERSGRSKNRDANIAVKIVEKQPSNKSMRHKSWYVSQFYFCKNDRQRKSEFQIKKCSRQPKKNETMRKSV